MAEAGFPDVVSSLQEQLARGLLISGRAFRFLFPQTACTVGSLTLPPFGDSLLPVEVKAQVGHFRDGRRRTVLKLQERRYARTRGNIQR
ncbi:hypothetical protein V5799_012435 [Amblyomma americanum]|uniref:Uncharacterized protein n=1 Tax=Amblyomma americanum TaxID=6943 RepID=A0AAQ4EEF7_AMBAM